MTREEVILCKKASFYKELAAYSSPEDSSPSESDNDEDSSLDETVLGGIWKVDRGR